MLRNFVVSSNIASVGWENGVLEIEFKDGDVYQYFGVPKSVYDGLMAAYSKGGYFHRYIRDVYSYQEVA